MRDSHITSKERLQHILQAISETEIFIKGFSKKAFLNNPVLINATLFQFAIIGEAIIHIDNDVLSKYDYPWHKVRGFRNFMPENKHS